MIARSSIVLGLVLALSLPGVAQDARRLPSDGEKGDADRVKPSSETSRGGGASPTFDDLKNSLGDLEQRESKDEKDRREAIVQKNTDETLRIYSEALGKRNGELQNLTRRLDANKGLEGKYDTLLKTARNSLATTRAQFINRTVALKKTLDDGKISKDAYDKLAEEDTKRFRNRERELLDDIAFYQEEFQNAQRSAKDLATRREVMTMDPFGGPERTADREKVPQPGLEQKLKKTLSDVSGYGSSSVVDSLR